MCCRIGELDALAVCGETRVAEINLDDDVDACGYI